MEKIDILINDGYDLKILSGDFDFNEATRQHQTLLLLCSKGDYKEFPTRCVGLHRFLENHNRDTVAREIDVEFSRDGMKVDEISFTDGSKIEIEAAYV